MNTTYTTYHSAMFKRETAYIIIILKLPYFKLFVREQKTSSGINLTVSKRLSSEGPAEKKAKKEQTNTVMVEKVKNNSRHKH